MLPLVSFKKHISKNVYKNVHKTNSFVKFQKQKHYAHLK